MKTLNWRSRSEEDDWAAKLPDLSRHWTANLPDLSGYWITTSKDVGYVVFYCSAPVSGLLPDLTPLGTSRVLDDAKDIAEDHLNQ